MTGRTLLRKLKRKAGRLPLLVYYIGSCAGRRPNPDKVLFFAFQGQYACNPKYICEKLLENRTGKKLVWVVYKDREDTGKDVSEDGFPESVELVRFDTQAYYRELSEAGFLVDNAFDFAKGFFFKRKGQVFIETMHGSLGIKRIGKETGGFRRNRRGILTGMATDAVLSNSDFETGVYETSFWDRSRIRLTGHPRNDLFFSGQENLRRIREKVCRITGTDPAKRFLLYAPTFRSGREKDASRALLSGLDFPGLCGVFGKRFGGEWTVLYRAHKQNRAENGKSMPYCVCDVSGYPDIQELMAAADAGITDYSSWIFDFLLTGKPGFLYVPDLESYQVSPGFYYPLEETPFAVCRDYRQLSDAVSGFQEEQYRIKVRRFLDEKGCMEDGRASERAAVLICRGIEAEY